MTLINEFTTQFETLKRLFGVNVVEYRLSRLNHIYETTEKKWKENLTRIEGIPIKSLVIAEAPPWTETREVRYFYNTFGSHWHIRLWYAFFPNETRPSSIDVGLIKLAKKGFLLIDSLPFAMKYSSTVRNKPLYFQLVKECLPFLMNKVNNHSITWAKNVRLAFAFKLNALAVIKALPSGLALPTNEVIQLHEQLIAADGSGYTNSNMLRNILGID